MNPEIIRIAAISCASQGTTNLLNSFLMEPLIITLDGPAGSGKSTVAGLLAKRLGMELLDTGAMYRGLTAHCLDCGIDPVTQTDSVVVAACDASMRFDWAADPPRLYVAGRDVTPRLRDPDVTANVSDVASIADVRLVLVQAQRRIAGEHPRLVTEGRDQGSVVFHKAAVKFYLDANPQIRASRRAGQLREAGKTADEATILQGITQRDRRDTHRQDGPLICPDDAVRIDTSSLTLDQVVDLLEEAVRQRVGIDLAAKASGSGSDS